MLARALLPFGAQHHSADFAAQGAYLLEKLLVSAVVLAAAPLFLAFKGAPTLAEATLFALALNPMAAAILARTGRAVPAHAAAVAGSVAIAVVLALTAGVPGAAALPWLMVAQLEAAASFSKGLIRWTAAVNVAALAVIALVGRHGPTPSDLGGAVAAVLALAAAVPVALRLSALVAAMKADARRDALRHGAVSRALGDLVIGFDGEGLVEHASAECEGMLGVPCADLQGRGLFEHVHVADRPSFLKLVADAAYGHETLVGELRLRQAPGAGDAGTAEPRHIWVEMRVHPVRGPQAPGNGDGRAPGVAAVLRDVTASRLQAVAIAEAHLSATVAGRSQDEFMANMSHELRTPLNAIIGFSEMLGSRTLRPTDGEKQREYARIIHQSGQHLLEIVNSILDMAKIRSGTFALLPEPFDVADLVGQCLELVAGKAAAGAIQLVPTSASACEVVADRRACKQILLNLLSNAIKFTPEQGRVSVEVRVEGTSFCLVVTDSGIGIREPDLQRLGTPFFQAGGALNRPFEGTGLGLSVVRGLVSLHGGTVAVESEVAKGTIVTVRLPLDCRRTDGGEGLGTIEVIPRHAGTRRVIEKHGASVDYLPSKPKVKRIA